MDIYRYCPECGNRVLLGMRFCTRCGTPIPQIEEDVIFVPEPTADEILSAAEITEPVKEEAAIQEEQKMGEAPQAEEPETYVQEAEPEQPAVTAELIEAEPETYMQEAEPEQPAVMAEPIEEEPEASEAEEPEQPAVMAEPIEAEPETYMQEAEPEQPAVREELPEKTMTEPEIVPEEDSVRAEIQRSEEAASMPDESDLNDAMISNVISTLEKDAMEKTAKAAVEEVVSENLSGISDQAEQVVEKTLEENKTGRRRKRKRYDPDTGEAAVKKRKRFDPDSGEPLE
ncbi:MAG: zinc-ribbon domain-containing protein [Solobacterium sp.]|nr:zinc-ribbon domain-containing protein [Solobacterium sp.]